LDAAPVGDVDLDPRGSPRVGAVWTGVRSHMNRGGPVYSSDFSSISELTLAG
jgi:hypothetical protein